MPLPPPLFGPPPLVFAKQPAAHFHLNGRRRWVCLSGVWYYGRGVSRFPEANHSSRGAVHFTKNRYLVNETKVQLGKINRSSISENKRSSHQQQRHCHSTITTVEQYVPTNPQLHHSSTAGAWRVLHFLSILRLIMGESASRPRERLFMLSWTSRG